MELEREIALSANDPSLLKSCALLLKGAFKFFLQDFLIHTLCIFILFYSFVKLSYFQCV